MKSWISQKENVAVRQKGEIVAPKEDPRLTKQLGQKAGKSLKSLNKTCTWGGKKNSKGKTHFWAGYKLHLDVTDLGITVTAVVTGANVHDSQVAIPMEKMTERKISHQYSLMDAAYDAPQIRKYIQEKVAINPAGNIGTFNIYKIAVKTTFHKKEDIFDHYQEEYFILDLPVTDSDGGADHIGYWTGVDPIVTDETGSWTVNSKAREVMELHYQDDSTRYEWIVTDSKDGEEYAHFVEDDITSIQSSAIAATVTEMDWSSKVYFYQNVNNWVDFWYEENKEVYGIRYYTDLL